MLSLGSAKYCHIGFLFLTAFTVIIFGQQVDLNGPSLSSGRQYYCVDEELVFTCSGSGAAIRWTVPSLFTDQSFLAADPVNLSMPIAGVHNATINLQQTTPTLVTSLTIQNVPDITVECSTNVAGSMNTLSLTSSTTPNQVQDLILDLLVDDDPVEMNPLRIRSYIANISWTPVNGTFDFKHYRVQLCFKNGCMDISNTTTTSMEVALDISLDENVYVLVSTESQCGDVGAQSRSGVILKMVPEPYQDFTAITILVVVCCVLLAIPPILIVVLCFKYYFSKRRSACSPSC